MKKQPIEKWEPLIFDLWDKKEPRYYVSNFGRIKAYTHISNGNILNGGLRNGYPCLDAKCYDSKRKRLPNAQRLIHRIVAKYFVPNPSKKKKVIHLDHDRLNNHPSNLAWATDGEALKHNRNNPRYQKKVVYNSRLMQRDVDFIRMLCNYHIPITEIAKYYQYSEMQISRIKSGENWKK